jgi:hypothetical protein
MVFFWVAGKQSEAAPKALFNIIVKAHHDEKPTSGAASPF